MVTFDGSIYIHRPSSSVFDQDQLVVMHNDSPGTHVVFRLSVAPAGRGETLLRFWVHAQLTGFNRLLEPLARMVLGPARRKTLVDIKEYVEAVDDVAAGAAKAGAKAAGVVIDDAAV